MAHVQRENKESLTRKYVQYMTYTVKNRLKGPRKMATSFTSTASYMHILFKI